VSVLSEDRTLAQVRALFPYLGQRTYLDTASAGLAWAGHGAAVARFFDSVKSRGYDAADEWRAVGSRVRERLARWLAIRPESITFLSNTTEALNLVAHSLRYAPGDQIVVAADEFPSVQRVWNPAVQGGADIVRVPIPSEEQRQDALIAALGPRARVLAVSHTHSSTGTTVDLQQLGEHCRRYGTLLVVDGLQAMGAIPVQLQHVDVYASSFFKWMLSGFGIAILVTSSRAREAMSPAYQGYANIDDSAQLQYAHVNYPALYGLDATLDMFESFGWDLVYRRVQMLGEHLHQVAREHGLVSLTPASRRAGIQVFKALRNEACCAWLSARGVSVAPRGEGVRVSPHFYNTPADVERCVTLLADAIRHFSNQ